MEGVILYPTRIYLRPLDLSVDEAMQEMHDAIKSTGAKRLVIDSLVAFEMALGSVSEHIFAKRSAE